MPILDAPPNSSRVIWTSSSAAQEKSFNLNDIQCLKGKNMYASSKYAVDILCLALNDIALKSNKKVKFYSTCPGYCLSGMTESLLPSFVWSLFLLFFMFVGFLSNNLDSFVLFVSSYLITIKVENLHRILHNRLFSWSRSIIISCAHRRSGFRCKVQVFE
eukprot:Sdes_comp19719_c0_seq3m11672